MRCANCPKETTDPANCYEDEGFLRVDGIGEWVCSDECEEVALAANNKGENEMPKDSVEITENTMADTTGLDELFAELGLPPVGTGPADNATGIQVHSFTI